MSSALVSLTAGSLVAAVSVGFGSGAGNFSLKTYFKIFISEVVASMCVDTFPLHPESNIGFLQDKTSRKDGLVHLSEYQDQ